MYGSYNCQSERSPEIVMISQIPTIGGHQNTSHGGRNMEKTLTAFWGSFAKPFLPKIGHSKPSKIVEI